MTVLFCYFVIAYVCGIWYSQEWRGGNLFYLRATSCACILVVCMGHIWHKKSLFSHFSVTSIVLLA